jgi:hypothetical protein
MDFSQIKEYEIMSSSQLKGVMCKVATSSSSSDSKQKTGGFLLAALANSGTSDWDGKDRS